jgi:thioester reductase-like protein
MRSTQAEVRNPVLALPGFRALQALPVESKAALRCLLRSLAEDARQRAEKSWRSHKAPMALYWKCVAVYAGHTARALRDQNI